MPVGQINLYYGVIKVWYTIRAVGEVGEKEAERSLLLSSAGRFAFGAIIHYLFAFIQPALQPHA